MMVLETGMAEMVVVRVRRVVVMWFVAYSDLASSHSFCLVIANRFVGIS